MAELGRKEETKQEIIIKQQTVKHVRKARIIATTMCSSMFKLTCFNF
jgi:hypothetical protein